MKAKTLSLMLIGSLAAIGCGGSSIPVAKVADSQATIRAAEEAGAQKNPQASLHLKLARDQLRKAQILINDDENERAGLFLNQAQADAELALALAHESTERNATRVSQIRVQELQQGQPAP